MQTWAPLGATCTKFGQQVALMTLSVGIKLASLSAIVTFNKSAQRLELLVVIYIHRSRPID